MEVVVWVGVVLWDVCEVVVVGLIGLVYGWMWLVGGVGWCCSVMYVGGWGWVRLE